MDDGVLRTAVAALLARHRLVDAGEAVHLEPMAGGYRNHVFRWRRAAPSVDRVVKVFVDAPDNPLFPSLPDHEAAALALLAGLDLAPEPVLHVRDDAIGHVLCYEMVPGEPWTSGPRPVGRLLCHVHRVDPARSGFAFRRLPSSPDEITAQSMRILDRVAHADLAERVGRAVQRARRRAGDGGPATCFVHTDAGPGNIVVGGDGPRLIDWQCPGLGDPVEDLAGFASAAIQILYDREPIDCGAIAELLAGYDDIAADAAVDGPVASATRRFAAAAPLHAARIAAYCAYRTVALRDVDPVVSARYADALAAQLDELGG